LRVEVWQAELTTPAASGGHLDHPEGGAPCRGQQRLAGFRMAHFHEAGQCVAPDRLVKQFQRLLRFATALHNAIDPEVLVTVSLGNLPAAGPTDDHLEGRAIRAFSQRTKRSEERRVGKECRSRWSPY